MCWLLVSQDHQQAMVATIEKKNKSISPSSSSMRSDFSCLFQLSFGKWCIMLKSVYISLTKFIRTSVKTLNNPQWFSFHKIYILIMCHTCHWRVFFPHLPTPAQHDAWHVTLCHSLPGESYPTNSAPGLTPPRGPVGCLHVCAWHEQREMCWNIM